MAVTNLPPGTFLKKGWKVPPTAAMTEVKRGEGRLMNLWSETVVETVGSRHGKWGELASKSPPVEVILSAVNTEG